MGSCCTKEAKPKEGDGVKYAVPDEDQPPGYKDNDSETGYDNKQPYLYESSPEGSLDLNPQVASPDSPGEHRHANHKTNDIQHNEAVSQDAGIVNIAFEDENESISDDSDGLLTTIQSAMSPDHVLGISQSKTEDKGDDDIVTSRVTGRSPSPSPESISDSESESKHNTASTERDLHYKQNGGLRDDNIDIPYQDGVNESYQDGVSDMSDPHKDNVIQTDVGHENMGYDNISDLPDIPAELYDRSMCRSVSEVQTPVDSQLEDDLLEDVSVLKQDYDRSHSIEDYEFETSSVRLYAPSEVTITDPYHEVTMSLGQDKIPVSATATIETDDELITTNHDDVIHMDAKPSQSYHAVRIDRDVISKVPEVVITYDPSDANLDLDYISTRSEVTLSHDFTQPFILDDFLFPKLDTFPQPGTVPCLTHTPPSDRKQWRQEELFWSEKRRLLSDMEALRRWDERALEASDSLKSSPADLVSHLTEGLTNDIARLRVIFRWLAHNVWYDIEAVTQGSAPQSSVEGVLRTGKAICAGYTNLLKFMCNSAGLECEVISGLSKGEGYHPGISLQSSEDHILQGDHAWNKVKVHGAWYLCDPTWAAGFVDDSMCYTQIWSEAWFIVQPETFLLTHLPLDSSNGAIVTRHELLDDTCSSVDTWHNWVKQSPLAIVLEIKLSSHLESVIVTDEPEVTIVFGCPHASFLAMQARLAVLQDDLDFVDLPDPDDLDQRVMLYRGDGLGVVTLRPPRADRYLLHVSGHVSAEEEGHQTTLLYYQINSHQVSPMDAFPGSALHPSSQDAFLGVGVTEWGESLDFVSAGFRVVSPRSAVVQCEDGVAVIRLSLPTEGYFPNLHQLHHPDFDTVQLQRCVAGWRTGREAVYTITCPQAGEYRWNLHLNFECPTTSSVAHSKLTVAVSILVKCDQPAATPFSFPASHSLAGPVAPFHKTFDLSSTAASSLLKFPGESTIDYDFISSCKRLTLLHLSQSRPVKMRAELRGARGPDDLQDCVALLHRDTQVTLAVSPPESGFYTLVISASDDGTNMTKVAFYHIEARVETGSALPLEVCDRYGFWPGFTHNGMSMIRPAHDSPLVSVSSDRCQLVMDMPKPLPLVLKLYSDTNDVTTYMHVKRHASQLHFYFNLPRRGYYRLTCWLVDQSDPNESAEMFSCLIYSSTLLNVNKLFPYHPNYWGVTSYGYQIGLCQDSGNDSVLFLEDEVSVTLKAPLEVRYYPMLEDTEGQPCSSMTTHKTSSSKTDDVREVTYTISGQTRVPIVLKVLGRHGSSANQLVAIFLIIPEDESESPLLTMT